MGTYCNKGTHEISQQKNDIFSVIALRMLYILEALAFSGLDILLLKEAKRHFTSTEKAVKKKKKSLHFLSRIWVPFIENIGL